MTATDRTIACDHAGGDQSFNSDPGTTSIREYSLSDEDYDSYDETCQNNMQDVDDWMSEWQSN